MVGKPMGVHLFSLLFSAILTCAPDAFAQEAATADPPLPILIVHAPNDHDPRLVAQRAEAMAISVSGLDAVPNRRTYRLFTTTTEYAAEFMGLPDEAAVLSNYSIDPSEFAAVLIVLGGRELGRSDNTIPAGELALMLSAQAVSHYCGVDPDDQTALLAAARRNLGCAEAAADYASERPTGDPTPFVAILFARIFALIDCQVEGAGAEEGMAFMLGMFGPVMVAEARDRHNLDDEARRLRLGEALLALADDRDAMRELASATCRSFNAMELQKEGPARSTEWIISYAPTLHDQASVGISTTWYSPDGLNVEIGIETRSISHLAEYRRRLLLRRGNESASRWLSLDTGGGDRVQIYATPDSALAYVDAFGNGGVLALDGDAVRMDRPETTSSWRYLGAFELVAIFNSRTGERLGREHRFVPGNVRGECSPSHDTVEHEGVGHPQAAECLSVRFDVAEGTFVVP